ncbi:ABC transporter ATP-binding protein [Sphingomonas sp. 28-62-11]|uniref:ABC transporter ATP-binding protein n=1 Tax=Sphingomonas sp. 28-62-11 TaxID=1970432 RepID=UPI000BCC8AF3|nr:MAG: ABC transporter ATP-binding protein [Sphingomonas sp. 28-62-11]
MAAEKDRSVRMRDVVRWARPILGPDQPYFTLVAIYGAGISLLSLATPISVQMLINSVANTALPAPLFTLSAILFALLMVSAVMSAMRAYLMELFGQRFFARMVAEITLRAVHARNPFFGDERRVDLFDRYFEVMNVQKSMPSLLIGLFTILLQSAVGFVVTSFYHPVFLGFNLIFILAVWLIWRVWSRGAMTTRIELSHAKYATARWLEGVGASNGFYKSSRHLDFAIDRSEAETAAYIGAYRRHVYYSLTQTTAFLILYAVASAGLLALGGWLVIQSQLSIGQLVAAELILSSIFYGAAQLGPYLDAFYDLVAALEELSLLNDIPQDSPGTPGARTQASSDLAFADVRLDDMRFDLQIPHGSRLIASAEDDVQRAFALLLKRDRRPEGGFVTLGGADLATLDPYDLRADVVVLDRPLIVESSIIDYLKLASPDDSPSAMMAAVRAVSLDRRIGRLPDGLHTVLSQTGWPFSVAESMRLKFAAALLSEPKILVMSPLFDVIPRRDIERMIAAIRPGQTTMIYFTNREDPPMLDSYAWIGRTSQSRVSDQAEFDALRFAVREATDAAAR